MQPCGGFRCDKEGVHEIVCHDCGGSFGFLCDSHAYELEQELRYNMKKNLERQRREDGG